MHEKTKSVIFLGLTPFPQNMTGDYFVTMAVYGALQQ